MTTKEYNNAVSLHADHVYRFVLKQVGGKMLAEDIVQETFVKVWEKRETIEAEKIKSYLFTTAYHLMINALKKEKRWSGEEVENTPQTVSTSSNFDLKEILDQALETLPSIQKTVVLLRDYEGYAYDEIGEITGLTEAQVKVYIFRARKQLKTYLGQLENVL